MRVFELCLCGILVFSLGCNQCGVTVDLASKPAVSNAVPPSPAAPASPRASPSPRAAAILSSVPDPGGTIRRDQN